MVGDYGYGDSRRMQRRELTSMRSGNCEGNGKSPIRVLDLLRLYTVERVIGNTFILAPSARISILLGCLASVEYRNPSVNIVHSADAYFITPWKFDVSLMLTFPSLWTLAMLKWGCLPIRRGWCASPAAASSFFIPNSIAAWVVPAGVSAISFTSRVVKTSLMRLARDWRRIVVGPSNCRNNWRVSEKSVPIAGPSILGLPRSSAATKSAPRKRRLQ